MSGKKGVLIALAGSFVIILCVTIFSLLDLGDTKNNKKVPLSPKPTPTAKITNTPKKTGELAIIEEVDAENGIIHLFGLGETPFLQLTYGPAAEIYDKYGSLTYAASLKLGDIVRVEYDVDHKLVRMQKSTEHWELKGVDGFALSEGMLSYAGVNYRLGEDVLVISDGEAIDLAQLRETDRINLCGLAERILTVNVTKGHGAIRLVHTEAFQGAKVTFGDESHVLEGEPSYLVREGSYRVTVSGDKEAFVAEITVGKNVQQVIDLYEYGGRPIQTAQVRFHVAPYASSLKIDGQNVDYFEKDVPLEYGTHTVEASLNGFKTYQGKITVEKEYQNVKINLVEIVAMGGDTGDNPGGNTDNPGGNTGDTPGGNTDNPSGNTGDNSGEDKEPEAKDVFWISEALVAAGELMCDEEHYTYILSPIGATVYVEGIRVGEAPLRFGKLLGQYTIKLQKGDQTTEKTVNVADDGKSVTWEFKLSDSVTP